MLKSMIQQLDERRGGFGAMVSSPGLALPEMPVRENPRIPVEVQPANRPETATTLSGVVLSRLTSLKPDSPELKARLQEVIGEAASLLADADALEQECRAERRSNLEARHGEIKRQGRQQVVSYQETGKGIRSSE